MKKLNRILGFIIVAAIILSLLPTFATAAVGDSYTYHFNPTGADSTTAYTDTSHSYETTVKNSAGESVYAPWAYVRKYNITTGYPQPDTLKAPAMYVRGNANWWLALKIQIPESGIYDAKLSYTSYKACGGINIYLIPVTMELPSGYCAFSEDYADYQLNENVVSLYASSTKGNQSIEITTKRDITASEDGAEFYLVFQVAKSSGEYGSSSDARYAYLEGLTLTKTADVSVPKTDVEYFESMASYGFGTNYSELNSYVSVGTVSAGNVGSATKGTKLTLAAQKEVEIEGTTYKFVGWKRGGTSEDESIKDTFASSSYISFSNEDTLKLWSHTYLTAVYDKTDDTAGQIVEFYNQDGTFLDSATAEYVKGLATIPTVSLLGHTFEMWQYINENGEAEEFTPASELHEAVTRVVAKQNPKTVTITFADGTYSGETVESKAAAAQEYEYGALVNADAFYDIPTYTNNNGSERNAGACWYRNDLMTRTAANYPFYAWADMVVRPEFINSIPEEFRTPKIILDTKTMDDAYMIEYDVYSKNLYEIVEAGILFSDTADVTLRTFARGEKFTSQNNKIHGQFAAKPSDTWTNVRGYIIYRELESGNLGVVYSNDGTVSN